MAVRGRSTRISAPAPANESRPAALSRLDDGAVVEAGRAADVHDLGRAEAVQHQLRVVALDRAEGLLVPLDAELGRVAALQHDLGGAEVDRLAAAAQQLVQAVRPALGVVRGAVERAELARGDADVGVVDVAVDDVGRDVVGVARAAHRVGRLPERVQRRVGVERERFLGRDPSAGCRAIQYVLHVAEPTCARGLPQRTCDGAGPAAGRVAGAPEFAALDGAGRDGPLEHVLGARRAVGGGELAGDAVHVRAARGGERRVEPGGEQRADQPAEHVAAAGGAEPRRAGRVDERGAVRVARRRSRCP